jgi:iron complex outermembrane receptor protein
MKSSRYVSWSSAALATGLLAGPLQAADDDVRVRIARQPVRSALIDLALQANLSLGGPLDACRGLSPALSGRVSIKAAVTRLLADSGCTFSLADRRTVVIRAAPTPAPPDRATDLRKTAANLPVTAGLTEVVVTAQRYPNLPGRTPYAISAIGDDDLRRGDIEKLQDLAGQVAGMTVTNLGPGRDKILLRGLSDGVFTGNAQSIVALYLDDTPITYNAPDPDLRLVDVQRVEIMRGPQGTLYGGGSIGGVVRISTNKPDLDIYSGEVTLGTSTTAGGRGGTDIEGVVNLPLARGRVALRAVGYRDVRGGYIDNSFLGLTGVNGSTRQGFRLALRANLSPVWTFTANLTSQSIATADTQYGLRRLGPLMRDNQVREPHENDFDHESITVVGAGDWGRLTTSAAHIDHQFKSRYDATSAIAKYGLLAGPAALDEYRNIDMTVAEVTYATPTAGRLHGLVGAFVSTGRTIFDDKLGVYPAATHPPAYAELRTDHNDEAALYGEASYEITPRLVATAGLRWFDFRLNTASEVTQGGGLRPFQGDQRASGVSPKLLLSYTAASGNLYYLQVAEGYRPGGYNTSGPLGQAFDVAGAPTRKYQPDELLNYEAGAKLHWFDDHVQARIALFYAAWTTIQSDQYLAAGLPFTANIGNGQNDGLEVEGAWRINARLDLRAAALLNDPRLTQSNPNFSSLTDSGLPGVPSASGGLSIDYHQPMGRQILRLLGEASYVGSSHFTFNAKATYPMGNYVTIRASLSLEGKQWTATAALENPFNSEPNSFSFGNPFLIGQDQVLTPIRPRTVSLKLIRRF